MIPDDLRKLLPELENLCSYAAFELWQGQLLCALRWVGDAPGDSHATTEDARKEAQQLVRALGYGIGDSSSDHDSAYFYVLSTVAG